MGYTPLSVLRRVGSIINRIRKVFPDGGEADLMFGVVRQAIRDAVYSNTNSNSGDRSHRAVAVRFLREDLIHAEVCGVNPEWIRYLLTNELGLSLDIKEN